MAHQHNTLHNRPLNARPVPEGTPPLRVLLIGCGKSKQAHAAPARCLYTGSLFTAARQFAEHRQAVGLCDAWYVLSARHGVVHPSDVLYPYEATMGAKGADELATWRNKVDSQFRLTAGYGAWAKASGRLLLDVYAGKAYVDALPPSWAQVDGWEIREPHAGFDLPARRAAFREALGT